MGEEALGEFVGAEVDRGGEDGAEESSRQPAIKSSYALGGGYLQRIRAGGWYGQIGVRGTKHFVHEVSRNFLIGSRCHRTNTRTLRSYSSFFLPRKLSHTRVSSSVTIMRLPEQTMSFTFAVSFNPAV